MPKILNWEEEEQWCGYCGRRIEGSLSHYRSHLKKCEYEQVKKYKKDKETGDNLYKDEGNNDIEGGLKR